MNKWAILLASATLGLAAFAAAQQPGGTLVAAWAQDPVGLDPHITSARSSLQVLENVLDTLVVLDADQNVTPSLAESWEVTEDGLTWTFHLRDGVAFSNGREFSSADVVYTYERMLDPATASGQAYLLDGVTAVEAPDAATVAFTLAAPNPAFISKLASSKAVGIIAHESVEDGTINTSPMGTGPFMITDFQPGIQLTLERNPHYWQEGLPYLDAVEIRVISDESVRRSSLISGDVDWAISVPAQSLEELRGRDDVVVDEVPAGAYWYIGVNTEVPPLDDVRVRQALAWAINREQIAEVATFGTSLATQDPIPASSGWAADYAPYSQDLEQAAALLAEAGYEGGFELEIMPTTQYEESIRIAQMLQAQLAPLNITASIRTLEWAEWLQEQGDGNFDTFVCSWNGNIDPDDFFYAQHRTGEVFNFTGYNNPTVDELLAEGRGTAEPEERREVYEQINRIIVDEAPYIYLYNPLEINVYGTDVQGYQARPDQAIQFNRTWLDR